MGNYENVRPEVTLTAKDVESKNVNQVYDILAEIAGDMFELETAKQIELLDTVRETRPGRYADIIKERENDIEASIQDLIKELKDI